MRIETIDKIISLHKDGKTSQEIKNCLSSPKKSLVNKEEAIRLRSENKTLQEIADIYGVSRERIRQIVGNTGYIFQRYPKGTKKCYSCKEILKLNKFYKYKNGRLKRTSRCIKCTKLNVRKYDSKYKKEYLKGGKYYEKMKARYAVARAIRLGKIKKGNCKLSDYSCKGKIESHHYLGYEKEHWLDIEWYCRKHHRQIDINKFYISNTV